MRIGDEDTIDEGRRREPRTHTSGDNRACITVWEQRETDIGPAGRWRRWRPRHDVPDASVFFVVCCMVQVDWNGFRFKAHVDRHTVT